MSITVQLNGRVDSNVPVTNTWSVVSGDVNKVSFVPNTHTLDADAVITAAGEYVLRLTSVTGEGLMDHDDMTITTIPNQTPMANAGADFSAIATVPYTLNGSATDDAYPDANSPPLFTPHTLAYTWTKVSGPGTVTFSPSSTGGTSGNVANPTVTFSTAGSYVLQLSVSDTKAAGTDTVAATVTAQPGTMFADATPANPGSNIGGDVEYRVDLSRLDNAWWTNMVGAAGQDIRVTDASNNPLPFDVINVSKVNQKGLLVYKRPVTTVGVIVRIWNGASPAVFLDVNDTYGQYNAYRSDCRCFYPGGGGGGLSRTRNTAEHVTVVGGPVLTTGNAGPIGSENTTFSNGKYCYRSRGGTSAYNAPITISAAVGVALAGSEVAFVGGVVGTNNGSVDSTKDSFYVKGVLSGGNQTIKAGQKGTASSPVPEASTATAAHSTWYHYSGTVAASGASRKAVGDTTTNTSSTAVTLGNEFDYMVIGAYPRLSPSSASEFCTVETPIALWTMYNADMPAVYLEYQGIMLAQATMFPTWTTH